MNSAKMDLAIALDQGYWFGITEYTSPYDVFMLPPQEPKNDLFFEVPSNYLGSTLTLIEEIPRYSTDKNAIAEVLDVLSREQRDLWTKILFCMAQAQVEDWENMTSLEKAWELYMADADSQAEAYLKLIEKWVTE